MGSDNAKSSHRTRRIKERPSPQRSVDARSVGSRSAEESRHGRSNRSNGSAHDHGSVASSQSSALVVDAGAYKEMSNRHRRGRTPDPKSTGSSGCMKQSIFVSALLIAWVLFYVGKTFPEQVADAIGSIIQMNTAEDKISASSTHEQVDDEGGKAGDAEVNNVKENDPDTDLAALASGAGTNLWENVIQTPDPNDESAKSSDVAAGDSSTSSLSTGESTDDRPTKASGEKNEKMATRDVSLSKARSSNGDATKEISTSSNDPAMSDGQHSEGVDAATKSEDTTDSELTQSGNSIGGANNKQIDTPQMSDAQSVDANILDGETEQQVQFEGQENELQQSTGSPMGDSRDVGGSQDGSSNESTHDDASNGQQVGDEGVSDVDQGRLEESDGVQRTGGKQGKLRGSNTLQSIGGDQEDIGSMDASNNMSIQDDASNEQQEGDEGVGGVDQDLPHESSGATLPVEKQNKVRVSNTLRTNTQPLAEDNLSTSLRGSVEMQIPDDQGQITAMNLQTSQGDTLVDNGDPQRQGDVDTESMSLGDTTRTQDSLLQQDGGLLADDMPIRNGGGNGMILDDSGLQAVDGSMKDERQQGGVMMQSHATRPDIGGETAAGEGQPRQHQQLNMMSNDELEPGSGNSMTLHTRGAQMDDGSMPHQRQQDGDEIRSEVFEQNGSAGGDTYERNGAQEEDGVIVEQNLLRQGGGGMLQGSVVEMEDESMAQQRGAREGSNHMSLQNGDVAGMVGEDYDSQTTDGVLPKDMISQRGVDGMQSQDAALETEGDSMMQQHGVGTSDEMLEQNGHTATVEEMDAVPMRDGSVTPNQVQDGEVIGNDSFVEMVDSNGLVHQNSDMQINHGSTARMRQQDGVMPPADSTHNGGDGSGQRQRENIGMMDSSLSEQNAGAGGTMRQQKSGSMTLQQDLRTTSRDPSSQNGGSDMPRNDMDGGSTTEEQMIEQDQGMLTNDLTSQDSGAAVSNRLSDAGESGRKDARLQTPSRHQTGPGSRQSAIFNEGTLGEADSRASGGLVGTVNRGSLRQDSQGDTLENSSFAGGSVSKGNAGETVGNSMVDGTSNILQSQSTGSRNLPSQQSDRQQSPVTQHQGHRRLQEMSEPLSPYENMGATELAQYVNNHALYRNLVNFDEDLPFDPSSQVPYLFHIHKSGGSSMKHMLTCMGLTQTRRGSSEGCDDQDDFIHVCPLVWGTVVNADASSPKGIERIKKLGIFDSNVPKLVITTSRFYEALSVFTPQHRGRLFLILRDPVERAISKYYYNQVATWEKNYNPSIANMTLIEFAQSRACYDNWITRRLIHKMNPNATVTMGDLRLAKEVLRQKALILLLSDFEQSSYRMVQYFDWGMTATQHWCGHRYSKVEVVNNNPHPMPTKDSPEWAAIRDRNLIDVELYRYALELYHNHQGKFLYERFGPLTLPEAVDPTRKL